MQIIDYTPAHFGMLHQAVEQIEARGEGSCSSLSHRQFVDHYYAARDSCKLYLLANDQGAAIALIGIEQMPFEHGNRKLLLGFGSNFYSLRPGAGGYLFMHWLKSVPIGLAFGASQDALRILSNQKWTFFEGTRTLHLNTPIVVYPTDPGWRSLAKIVLRTRPRPLLQRFVPRLEREAQAGVSVQEESSYSEDMLPRTSQFAFRFAPDVRYLQWRYNLDVPFVRYRLFRIVKNDRSCGYVIINDLHDKLMVAQCDAEDPATLASGVLRSIAIACKHDTEPREVLLASSHHDMRAMYARAGFRIAKTDRPFVLGTRGGSIDLPADTSRWLINFDWGDNGLRGPFRDQQIEELACRP